MVKILQFQITENAFAIQKIESRQPWGKRSPRLSSTPRQKGNYLIPHQAAFVSEIYFLHSVEKAGGGDYDRLSPEFNDLHFHSSKKLLTSICKSKLKAIWNAPMASRAIQLWQKAPIEIKDSHSLYIFKEKINFWNCERFFAKDLPPI